VVNPLLAWYHTDNRLWTSSCSCILFVVCCCVMGSGLVPALLLFMMMSIYASQALDLLLPSLTPRCWDVCLRVGFVNDCVPDCVGCAVGVCFSPPSGTPGLGPAWSSLGRSISPPCGGPRRSTVVVCIDYYYLLLSIIYEIRHSGVGIFHHSPAIPILRHCCLSHGHTFGWTSTRWRY
jgi:hypothetical protein